MFVCWLIFNRSIEFSPGVILQIVISGVNSWFVQMYILLMVASPAINMFIKSLSMKILVKVSILLFVLSSILGLDGFFFKNFSSGYSFDFLVVLYIIGACLFRYKDQIKRRKIGEFLSIYLLCLAILVLWALLTNKNGKYFNYSLNNPLIVLMSISVFCLFLKMDYRSKVVNAIARGSFTVFLLHTNDFMRSYFCRFIQYLYVNIDSVFLFVISVFVFAVCIYLFSMLIHFVYVKLYNSLPFKRKISMI